MEAYTHRCNGTCGERLDQQQKTIKEKNARIDELEKKGKAWNEFVEYFDSVVTEEGYVYDTDENIVVNIQNIRMNYHFEEKWGDKS
ncbi:hypothetical protein ACFOU0_06005 [Salinicoccus sesuvii]|uniref:Uncharacterized protein n=1 Tax=Salinicoccus sesuvii TaxID=868281 RepID=A0ABV7N5J2_9STAP